MQLNWMRLLSAAQLVIVALAPNCERHAGLPRASVLSGGAIRLAGEVRPPGLGKPALCLCDTFDVDHVAASEYLYGA